MFIVEHFYKTSTVYWFYLMVMFKQLKHLVNVRERLLSWLNTEKDKDCITSLKTTFPMNTLQTPNDGQNHKIMTHVL